MIRTKLKRMLAASLCAALCLSSVPVYAEEIPNGQTEVQTDTMQEDVQQDGTPQRAVQFPDGVMERMIDFNPEEETITIPTPQTAGLNEIGRAHV